MDSSRVRALRLPGLRTPSRCEMSAPSTQIIRHSRRPPRGRRAVAALPLGPAPLPHFGASLPLERPTLPLLLATMPLFSPSMSLEGAAMPVRDTSAAAFFATHGPSRGSAALGSPMYAPFWCNAGAPGGNVGPLTGTRAPFRATAAPERAGDGPTTGIDAAFFATGGALTGGDAGESNEVGAGGCGAARSKRGLGAVVCRASIAGACRDGGPRATLRGWRRADASGAWPCAHTTASPREPPRQA